MVKSVTALDAVLEADISTTSTSAKRGQSNHLKQGLGLQQAKRFTETEQLPSDADIVEIDAGSISFLQSVNHREQQWLSTDNKSFASLIKSIEQVGQKIPILVRPKNDSFELIYGSRRRAACAHLGVKVKALIVEGVSDNEAHELAILENTNHSGLSPLEEARAVLAYKERNAPITDEQVGIVFSKSRTWVSFQQSFANLDPLLINACLDPWSITERATRDIRAGKVNYKSALKKMKDDQVPFSKLIKIINGTVSTDLEILKNEEGRVVAEVSPPSRKHGRAMRRVSIYEGADKKEINELMASLLDELNA